MASGSEDEIEGAWYFGSNQYDPQSSSESEQEFINREAKSSKFIPKAMFLGAVARPRWNTHGQCIFDGKIGIFPFINRVAAQRDSKNRPRGAIEIKPTESVTQEVYRNMLIQSLIPAILRKWPREGPSVIFIQQDNARVHITNDDPVWQQHNVQGGLTFILTQQPPNSPDCNILDLGFFRSIQSLMHKKMPQNMTELIGAVEEAYEELHPKTLTNVWISLQHHLNEILKVKGSNDYVQPHLGKKVEEDNGRLRIQVRIPTQLVRESVAFVNPSMNPQASQTQQENEDVAQSSNAMQEAYEQGLEETQG